MTPLKIPLPFIPAASGLPSCTLRFSHLSTGTFGAKHLSQQPRGHKGAQEQGEADSEPRCTRQPILSRRHLLTCPSLGLKQSFPLESTDAPRGKLSKLEVCVHTGMQSWPPSLCFHYHCLEILCSQAGSNLKDLCDLIHTHTYTHTLPPLLKLQPLRQ